MFPLGIRLNNPGHFYKTTELPEGATKAQDHDKFVRFISPVYGIVALMRELIAQQSPTGLNNITELAARWKMKDLAPYSYIAQLCKVTGFAPSELIDLKSEDTLIAVTQGIIVCDNGWPTNDNQPLYWYDENLYRIAASLVLNG